MIDIMAFICNYFQFDEDKLEVQRHNHLYLKKINRLRMIVILTLSYGSKTWTVPSARERNIGNRNGDIHEASADSIHIACGTF